MNDPAAVYVIIYGHVQGVYYRAFARRRAAELGLAGYTRNLRDGTVEVRAEGERERLQRLISHLENGPPAARVEKIVADWSEYTGNYTAFNVEYHFR